MKTKRQELLRPSNLQGAWLCPGKPMMEATLPPAPDDDDSMEGRRSHTAIAEAIRTDIVPDDYAVRECYRFARGLIEEDPRYIIETEVSIRLACGIVGTPDLVLIAPPLAIVVDWKTGHKTQPFPASRNLQLAAYAYGIAARHDIERVEVHLFSPWVFDESRHTSAVLAPNVLDEVERIIERIYDDERTETVAGPEQCAFCRAKAVCAAFHEWAKAPLETLPMVLEQCAPPAVLTNVLQYRERLNLLNRMMDSAMDQAKAILKAGGELALPDGRRCALKPGANVRHIDDIIGAEAQTADLLPTEAFAACCKLSVPDLERAVKAATGLKGKAAAAEFNRLVGPLIETRQNEPSLVGVNHGD